ncbi:exodeoxyribonuclease V subunit alpha [Actinoplanes couchii]|uniref:RecBCD enzyme subunit RecD n=1 Tax=Actinoplanes couchii TaxID=403638 RepID=A0ABQ3X8N6_9ACTN|nr:exodeoxyribonuclease V subunit alpha [Actinoplanes couchii]MDR6320119.1 exodeoxyribonuclease V alpha subunit [Actinoplanes couchii]GID54866.1 RecBCD enzyme subunit RecD [Actinoplanes couchii]
MTLTAFDTAGVLDLADLHVASRIGSLTGETDETVRLAAALAVRALRMGSVCVDLATVSGTVAILDAGELPWPEPAAWLDACARSPMVSRDGTPGRPLRLANGLLYLDRYWREEESIRRQLQQRATDPPAADLTRLRADLDRLFDASSCRQRLAAAVSTLRWVSVLAGGPGTGKTTAVARMLAVLRAQPGGPLRIALAAPTGKAAARLTEAVREAAAALPDADRAGIIGLQASTLHRLLGRQPGTRTRFRHHRAHRLPYDVIVVDESSMVSLTLMARLIDAIRPDARLILVGDPGQLASVEAGAVLGDIVAAPGLPEPELQSALTSVDTADSVITNGVVTLDRIWRFGGDLAALAAAVRRGDADAVVGLLRGGGGQLEFVETSAVECAGLREEVVDSLRAVAAAAAEGDAAGALRCLETHRLLCAHRRGPFGVAWWTAEVARWLGVPEWGDAVPGRPLLITANDYEAGLFNGDTGVIVQSPDGLRAVFARGEELVSVSPSRLSQAQPLYAVTVHRSQGSQFERVSLILPPASSPLLTRELFYTAVTRAKNGLRVLGTEEAVRTAVERPIARASGLRESLGVPV